MLAFLLLTACQSGAPADSLIRNPMDPLPERLSDVGLYPDLADRSWVTPEALAYEPQWPLWSNGSAKSRFIVPSGPVDTSGSAWSFPAGTLFFKTFEYSSGPVETRVMRKSRDGWDYGTYAWDGPDAVLLDGRTPTTKDPIGPNGQAITHTIPVTLQCRTCHESSPSVVLGFSEVQLAVAPVDVPTAEQIDSGDPATDAFLGILQGNCVHCHNGGDGPSASYDLSHTVALTHLIGVQTQGSASASGVRVVPGRPDDSILYQAFSGETDDPEVAFMPPLGVDLRDQDAIDIVRSFIESLETP